MGRQQLADVAKIAMNGNAPARPQPHPYVGPELLNLGKYCSRPAGARERFDYGAPPIAGNTRFVCDIAEI